MRHVGLGLCLVPGLLGAWGAASAQTMGEEAAALPEISVSGEETASTPIDGYVPRRAVTATKSDSSILETPQSISVVTSDQLRDQNVQNLNEAMRYVSGVTAETRGGDAGRYDLLKIRGFDPDYYWNGLKLQNDQYIGPQIDSYLLDRIDILKGPSSVLYGQGTAGGLINQVSKLPTAAAFHEVGFEAGTFSRMQATLDLGGPLTQDGRFLYRLTGVGFTQQSQIKHNRDQRIAVQPSFSWIANDRTRLDVYALYQYDPDAGPYGGITASGTVLDNPNGKISRNLYDGDPSFEKFNRTQTALGYQFSSGLGSGLTLRLNGRWFRTAQDYSSVYASGYLVDDDLMARGTARSLNDADSYTMDNQLEWKFATGPVSHTALVGFDYQGLNHHYRAGFGAAPYLNAYDPEYYMDIASPDLTKTSVHANQWGIYFQDQLKYAGFVLTLSGRQDWAQTHNFSGGVKTKQSDDAFTGRAGLTYVFDNGIAPYVSYGESFSPQLGLDYEGKALKPEKAHQYEAGIKFQPHGLNALFTAAVFSITRSNLSTSGPDFLVHQNGKARSRGVELEAKARVVEGLDLTAGYTYLKAKYLDDLSYGDNRLPGVPHHSFNVWGDYHFASDTALRGLDLGSGLRYVGPSPNASNDFSVPGVTLVDAAVRYDLGGALPALKGAELSITAKNLLDKRYIASCYYGAADNSYNWCGWGYKRTVVGGITYRW